jgi:hypothetical protein
MRPGLAADLHERVIRMRGGETQLVRVSEIEVVYAHDLSAEAFAIAQSFGESFDECGLAYALHAIESDYEGPGWGRGLVLLEEVEDERDAEGGFVVYYPLLGNCAR